MIRVISFSTDRKIFEKGSAVRQRMIEYGSLFEELHIVVFSLKSQNFRMEQIAPNVLVYPTFSKMRISYMYDAVKLVRIIAKERNLNSENSVITAQDPFETGITGVVIKYLTKIPLQIQIHTDFLNPYFKNGILNVIRSLMSTYVLRSADRIRVVSTRIKDGLIQKLNIETSKVDILPVFIDFDDIRLKKIENGLRTKYPRYDFTILLASRLEKEKNISEVLDIVPEIINKYPKVGFIIVGNGRELENLQKKAVEQNISTHVVFEGWSNDVISYMKTADVFLVNSEFEGYGMTIIEAAACACPVITTDVGIAKEYIIDGVNGYICKVRDTECIKKRLFTLISDVQKYKEIKKKSLELSQKMSHSKYKYLEDYKISLEKTLLQ